MKRLIPVFLWVGGMWLLNCPCAVSQSQAASGKYQLIVHRGGIVGPDASENSLEALQKAIDEKYWMAEVDLRLTKDGVFIINHDLSLKRYFHVDRLISTMNWAEIKDLRSDAGTKVPLFEDVLKTARGKINLMIDNKIPGNDTLLFKRLINLLDQYKLTDSTLMIGTDESTEFFTGKLKLSCTRQQLEENMKRPDYQPSHYYLFSGDIGPEDVAWAKQQHILSVGVLNAWRVQSADMMEQARIQAEKLKRSNLRVFQIDAIFAGFF